MKYKSKVSFELKSTFVSFMDVFPPKSRELCFVHMAVSFIYLLFLLLNGQIPVLKVNISGVGGIWTLKGWAINAKWTVLLHAA